MRPPTYFRRQVEQLERRDAPALVPVGLEFRVNTYTTGNQAGNAIAMNANGSFIITWGSGQEGSGGDGIYAQRYDSAGVVQGAEIHVNSFTTGTQWQNQVAMDDTGNFVITWWSLGSPADGIYARRFDSSGVPLGADFVVSADNTIGRQGSPKVAMSATGDFVIAWTRQLLPNGYSDVYAQRYNSVGVAQGSEFLVNTFAAGYTPSGQGNPSAAFDGAGNFVVAWTSGDQDGSSNGVYAQRYDAAGVPQGTEFQVNSYTTGNQAGSAIAMDYAGNFVITWVGEGPNTGSTQQDIYARRFNPDGIAAGDEFLVNTYTTGPQDGSNVAMSSNGDFIVGWRGAIGQDGSSTGGFAQSFNALGTPIGAEFRVNTYTTNAQSGPRVRMDADGDMVACWRSYLQEGSGYEVYAQRYQNTTARVQSIQINDNTPQRSRVTSLTVPFNQPVTLGGGMPANAFTLTGPSGPIALAVDMSLSTATQTIATLTFSGPGTEFGSLADGRYTLTVLANQVVDAWGQALDGNGDGTPGDNYTFNFHRLFGDADGNGTVSAADFNAFRLAYGTGPSIFDFDDDGQTSAIDFANFRTRYGLIILP